MKIPSSLLRQRLKVTPYEGSGAHGPIFGDPVIVRARVEGRRRLVQQQGGTDLMSTATAFVRPDAPVAEQAKVEWDGRTFDVVQVLPAQGLTRATHLEVLLA